MTAGILVARLEQIAFVVMMIGARAFDLGFGLREIADELRRRAGTGERFAARQHQHIIDEARGGQERHRTLRKARAGDASGFGAGSREIDGLPNAVQVVVGVAAERGGADAADGQPVQLFEGKYGPYVKHGKVNATVPKDAPIDQVTLAQAIALIEERAARGGGAPRRGARRSAPKKTSGKSPDKKKPPPKKGTEPKPPSKKAPRKRKKRPDDEPPKGS